MKISYVRKLNQSASYMENIISINFCWTHTYVFVCRPPGPPEIYIYNEYSTEKVCHLLLQGISSSVFE